MTKSEFRKLVQTGPVILDGATGSNLQKRGMPQNVCPEKWITENADVMIALQREFIQAGTKIIYAPTFTANRIKLKEYGLENEIEALNTELVSISKMASQGKALVAGDITMTGEQLVPMGTLAFEDLITVYKEQIKYLEKAGVDLLVIETMMSLQETRAAVIAAKETCCLPIMVSLSFKEDGTTLYGTDPVTAVVVLQELGADAVGVNCSAGPDKLIPLIRKMKKYATVPLIAKPNAGLPYLEKDGTTAYDMQEEEFAAFMVQMIEAGANMVGGCCGTTPDFIRVMADAVKDLPVIQPLTQKVRAVASETQTVCILPEGKTLIIGERINPTGKKGMQEEIRNSDFTSVLRFAREQRDCNASLLDVNVGMSGIDEEEVMLQAINELSVSVPMPLCIDTSHIHVMESALRNYPGRALMNSISLEKDKADQMLPLAKKYGAMFILLPLTEAGLPKNLEEKKAIIRELMDKALKAGLSKEDIVVDGLVTTIGANKKAAIETLETIRYCRDELNLATVVGLGNISFGLPGRSYVNSAFLTMAIQNGLTMAIANPCIPILMDFLYTADLLNNKKDADLTYIDAAAGFQNMGKSDNKKNESLKKLGSDTELDNIVFDDVVKGARKKIVEDVKSLLDEGSKASQILNEMLIPGINKVSDLFEKKVYFLPQLIASAEAMKKAIEYLEPMLKEDAGGIKKPTIVMATVKGDVHDIGKNLVVMMLKNYGYNMIDLGKDVDKEIIVETAIKENAAVIGLSALMTTTMQEMKHVIEYAKERSCKAKVIVGGAVVTQEYADEIGADGYSKDASEAVTLVERILL